MSYASNFLTGVSDGTRLGLACRWLGWSRSKLHTTSEMFCCCPFRFWKWKCYLAPRSAWI